MTACLSPLVETVAIRVPRAPGAACCCQLTHAHVRPLGPGQPSPGADTALASSGETEAHLTPQSQNPHRAPVHICVPGSHTSSHRAWPGHTPKQCGLSPKALSCLDPTGKA